MSAHIAVLITTGSAEEGQSIARALVEERLAACVNILSPIHSVYRWEGKLQCDEETLLVVKTTSHRFEQLSLRVKQLHSYDTPEIVALPLVDGSSEYLDWVDAQTGPDATPHASAVGKAD
jgi:periplasmic divalent cation tolerance protein